MNIHRAFMAVASVLATSTLIFTGTPSARAEELITPPIFVPFRPDTTLTPIANSSIQCAATNVSTNLISVTIEIIDRNGMALKGPTAFPSLSPLNSTTEFAFVPGGVAQPLICKFTVEEGKTILGSASTCRFTGMAGQNFDCNTVPAQITEMPKEK